MVRIGIWLVAALCLLPTSSRAQTPEDADFDGNGVVDYDDFLALARTFGANHARFDLDRSGVVDFQDFVIFARAYLQHVEAADGSDKGPVVTEEVAGRVEIFDLPELGSRPYDIAVDARGIVWFTELGANRIGRFDPRTGTFVAYLLPTPGGQPLRIVVDSRGRIWFTEIGANRIGRLNPVSEEIREFVVPTPGSRPHGLAFDRRGILWFTQESANRIGRLNPFDGTFEEYLLPTPAAGVDGLLVDGEGALWFAERAVGKLGRLDPVSLEIEEFRTFRRGPEAQGDCSGFRRAGLVYKHTVPAGWAFLIPRPEIQPCIGLLLRFQICMRLWSI